MNEEEKNNIENTSDSYYQEAFSRNRGLINDDDQNKFRSSTIAIAGLGGVGGIYAQSFARMGIGGFHLADRDCFETVNMNRQMGAFKETIGKEKLEVIKNQVMAVNPFAKIKSFSEGFSEKNADDFFKGVSVAMDGIDFFNIKDRRLFFRKAREKKIYTITACPIGFGSSTLIFAPDGMAFDEYFDINDNMEESEMLLRFGVGFAPSMIQRGYFKPDKIDFKKKSGPSLISGILSAASLATSSAARIIMGKPVKPAPHSFHFDPFIQKSRHVMLRSGNRSLIQRIKLEIIRRIYMKKN